MTGIRRSNFGRAAGPCVKLCQIMFKFVSNYVKFMSNCPKCQIFRGPRRVKFFADVRDASNFFRTPSNVWRPAGPSCQILSDASNFSRTPSNSRRAAGPSCQILSDASNSHSDAVKFLAPGGPLCQILCSSVNGFLRTASNSRRPAGPSCQIFTQQRPSFVRTASESRMHPGPLRWAHVKFLPPRGPLSNFGGRCQILVGVSNFRRARGPYYPALRG